MSHDKPSMDEGKKSAGPTEAPGDVAGLYSWAKLEGSEYRDFSASRDQARASRRQRERPSTPKPGEAAAPPAVRGGTEEKAAVSRRAPIAQMGPRRLLTAVKKTPAMTQAKQPHVVAAPKRWAGLQSVFGRQGEPHEAGTQGPGAMVTPSLAFVSLAGGVGKTSLAASISHALAAHGERVLLVDTQPYGLLPLIVGAGSPVNVMTTEQGDAVSGSEGRLMDEVMRNAESVDRILIDVAGGSTSLLRQALRLSPTVLVVLTPDMASVASLEALQAFFRSMEEEMERPLPVHYLLNQFDPSILLHGDIQQALAGQLGDRLLPFYVRYSHAMREALAEGMTIDQYAPDSEIAEEIRHLAQWVGRLNQPAANETPNLRWRES